MHFFSEIVLGSKKIFLGEFFFVSAAVELFSYFSAWGRMTADELYKLENFATNCTDYVSPTQPTSSSSSLSLSLSPYLSFSFSLTLSLCLFLSHLISLSLSLSFAWSRNWKKALSSRVRPFPERKVPCQKSNLNFFSILAIVVVVMLEQLSLWPSGRGFKPCCRVQTGLVH